MKYRQKLEKYFILFCDEKCVQEFLSRSLNESQEILFTKKISNTYISTFFLFFTFHFFIH